jgi:hypothetical protein
METREIITMIGWPISCLLSVFAGWLIAKLNRKKKILVWGVVAESDLISPEIHRQLSIPVSIQVGGTARKSLSLVTLRIGNGGNEVIEKIEPRVSINPGAAVLYLKPKRNLGAYQECILGKVTDDSTRISFAHINPGVDCEFELLLSDYEAGSLAVDVAASGVTLFKRDPLRWMVPNSHIQNIGLSLFGLKYDSQTSHTADIASELKAIRRLMQSRESNEI